MKIQLSRGIFSFSNKTKIRIIKFIIHMFLLYYLNGIILAPLPFGLRILWIKNINVRNWFCISHIIVRTKFNYISFNKQKKE